MKLVRWDPFRELVTIRPAEPHARREPPRSPRGGPSGRGRPRSTSSRRTTPGHPGGDPGRCARRTWTCASRTACSRCTGSASTNRGHGSERATGWSGSTARSRAASRSRRPWTPPRIAATYKDGILEVRCRRPRRRSPRGWTSAPRDRPRRSERRATIRTVRPGGGHSPSGRLVFRAAFAPNRERHERPSWHPSRT